MATLSSEQVIQRNKTGDVSITYNGLEDSPGEKLWLSTTTLPYTVVDTKSVVANQQNRDTLEDRIVAAGEAQYTDIDLYATQGIGSPSIEQPLSLAGDGSEAFTVSAAAGPYYFDMNPFVTGGFEPLTYTIDAASETGNGTYTINGSVLVADGTSAGSDTVVVDITDRDGNVVTLTVAVTVSA